MKKNLSLLLLLLSLLSFSQNQEIGQSFVEILLKEKNFDKALTFLDPSIKDKITVPPNRFLKLVRFKKKLNGTNFTNGA